MRSRFEALVKKRQDETLSPQEHQELTRLTSTLEAAEAAWAALSTNSNSKATIKVLREAKYVAALAMTTLPSDKPLNDARYAVVTTLSDLVKALETDPAAQQEKIEKAKDAMRNLVWDLKAEQERRLRRLTELRSLGRSPVSEALSHRLKLGVRRCQRQVGLSAREGCRMRILGQGVALGCGLRATGRRN